MSLPTQTISPLRQRMLEDMTLRKLSESSAPATTSTGRRYRIRHAPVASHDRSRTIRIPMARQRAMTTLAPQFPRFPPFRLVQRLPDAAPSGLVRQRVGRRRTTFDKKTRRSATSDACRKAVVRDS